ncbi:MULTISPECIES: GPI inositol-deacylase [Actinosynnema]|uniref:GPI inositol-deacylase n=1 Tax=Actinosynnema TaxID=40566 RepID=UPI0020A2B2B0|nr:GPI inositol-deacylase [Actinosynnema pretiosum]MCP2096460.1 hypothetical protein [Actinosynnema pretiosum]
MTKVQGVHGIGNYGLLRAEGSSEAAAKALARTWSTALALPDIDLAIGYYAHHLHRGTAQGPLDDPAALTPEEQLLLVDWVDALAPVSTSQGPRTIRARQAADWITRRFGKAARLFAIAFCREVHTYLSSPDSSRRAKTRQAIADSLAAHRPDVVIAHSLGSVVAYETLWAHPDHDVELLITLGSPLAMPGVVAPRLRPGTNAKPPRVNRWINVADVGDLVALPRTGLTPHFTGVEQDIPVTVGNWDFHTATGYLATREVRALLTS